MRIRDTSICFALLLFAMGCEETQNRPDIGTDTGLPPELLCIVDTANEPAKAIPIALGERFQMDSQICPVQDLDWYTFELPPNSPLLTVELSFDQGLFSAVDLAYDIFAAADTERPVTGGRDENTQDNRSNVLRTHSLGPTGGKYYLRVRDNGNDEQDVRNAYAITLTAGNDPDPNEPNEDCAGGTALAGNSTGVIGADNDVDAFLVTVPAGSQIVDINVTTAEASNVDLSITLYEPDGMSLVASAVDALGEDGPTDLRLRRGIDSVGGQYCVIIQDDDNADANLEGIYTISVLVEAETDPQELAVRNDTPATATDLGAAGGSMSGVINSPSDQDWFKVTAQPGKIIQVDFDCPTCWSTMQPSIVFVYGHPTSPCDDGSACDYLLVDSGGGCTRDSDCASGVCRDTPAGRRCGMACSGDEPARANVDCPSFQCQQTANVSACAGFGRCTAEGFCGVQQVFVPQPQDITQGRYTPGDRIRTAQPAMAGVTYILVHDFDDDEESTATYSVNISVHDDPDEPQEPNNFYMPIRSQEMLDAANGRGNNRTQTGWTNQGGRAVATGAGCIGYDGDVDRFTVTGGNPCSVATGTAASDFCGLEITVSPRPPMPNQWEGDLVFFWGGGAVGGGAQQSALGADLVFGDTACGGARNECMVARGGNNDVTVRVRDAENNSWSFDQAHCYTWTLRSAPAFGCPASCPDRFNGDPTGNCICN